MEELQDAIEDAHYVNAIANLDDGPRPMIKWLVPSEEELEKWKNEKNSKLIARMNKFGWSYLRDYSHVCSVDDDLFFESDRSVQTSPTATLKFSSIDPSLDGGNIEPIEQTSTVAISIDEINDIDISLPCDTLCGDNQLDTPPLESVEFILSEPLGLYLFSQFLKEKCNDYIQINFVEEIIRYRRVASRRQRMDRGKTIMQRYLCAPLIGEEEKADSDVEGLKVSAQPEDFTTMVRRLSNQQEVYRPVKQNSRGKNIDRHLKKNENDLAGFGKDNADDSNKPKVLYKLPLKKEIIEHDLNRSRYTSYMISSSDNNPIFSRRDFRDTYEDSVDMESVPKILFAPREEGSKNAQITGKIETVVQGANNSCLIGLKGDVVDSIISYFSSSLSKLSQNTSHESGLIGSDTKSGRKGSLVLSKEQSFSPEAPLKMPKLRRFWSEYSGIGSIDVFDLSEQLVVEQLRIKYWKKFLRSELYKKLLNFLWYKDRKVVMEDFFTMRVLGRGGFGLVHACRKGTSGKLYAMKIMKKRRIKQRKSYQLTLNERNALVAIGDCPFVINLKYSFQSEQEIYLVLDLMTGGDLGFHLSQKGLFPRKEVQYYAARILLGLQALHDRGYVYRDLKPENCLLASDGRVKLTDLGLCVKATSTLHGAAGTRGYWAPEMLRRDSAGKRMNYGKSVDWFSFGCCMAEFISGVNPFRCEAALNFGLESGRSTKEKAIDHAILHMDPVLDPVKYTEDEADLCKKLLDKNEKARIGCGSTGGCEDIMSHAYFNDLSWEQIVSDRKKPPFVPARDVNAASQSEIGMFNEDKEYHDIKLDETDEKIYKEWDWTNSRAYAAEIIEFLIYERELGEPLLPVEYNNGCCCVIL